MITKASFNILKPNSTKVNRNDKKKSKNFNVMGKVSQSPSLE